GNTVTQTPPLLDHWLEAKLWRCALPSAFAFAFRAARDALPARHGLSRRPVAHPAKSSTSAQFLTPKTSSPCTYVVCL
ncbi:hypothetical protein, partial [Dickeya fangzhongdai]|uniref:hypothetical protein n=1 Tax=Dickeya fangzhongdai TaxID=1778540 RepID=UPI001F5B2C04